MCFARGSLASPTRGPVLLSYSSSSSIKEGQEVRMFMVSTLSCGCLAVSQSELSRQLSPFHFQAGFLPYSIHSSLLQLDLTKTLNLVLQSISYKYTIFVLSLCYIQHSYPVLQQNPVYCNGSFTESDSTTTVLLDRMLHLHKDQGMAIRQNQPMYIACALLRIDTHRHIFLNIPYLPQPHGHP